MQDNYEYVALVSLRVPGTMVFGYRPGDQVPAGVVESWELVVGQDVMPRRNDVIDRPADDADRSDWEAYAYGQGWDKEQVEGATLGDLKDIEHPAEDAPVEELPDPTAPPQRPEPDAKKADWVRYVLALGADPTWAEDTRTTKADLQDYSPQRDVTDSDPEPTPVVGDTVAENATEAIVES